MTKHSAASESGSNWFWVTDMHNAYVVTGTLSDAKTVTLDEALPLRDVKVRLVIDPVTAAQPRPYADVVADIRARQQARGHRPSTPTEIHAYLDAERSSWGD